MMKDREWMGRDKIKDKKFDNYCPCRDKQTERCYGRVYFHTKPGPGPIIICKGDCSARREWQQREDKRNRKQL